MNITNGLSEAAHNDNQSPYPEVVIVGAGFGGLRAARSLADAPVHVTLVDRNNYHLFQPLLYQVATAGVSPAEIAYPVRSIFRKQKNFSFSLADVERVDCNRKSLSTSAGEIPYDYLILAPGGVNNFFGIPSVEANAMGLKDLEDATRIRNQLLTMFEKASQVKDEALCRQLLTFVIVGGGPTGVECAGAVSELIRLVLVKDYPLLHQRECGVQVILLEGTDRLLAGYPKELSQDTLERLEHKQVDVRFNTLVTGFDGQQVMLKDSPPIAAHTLIWAAGVRATPLLETLGEPLGSLKRVKVLPTLQLPAAPDIFVIGDSALLEGPDGKPLPMVAPVAIQQAKVAAANIARMVQGQPLENFVYKDPGSLATIGRNAAVARLWGINFKGFIAWLLWLGVHILQLIGFRNRLIVMINWAWDYLLYDRAIRLIHPGASGTTLSELRPSGDD